MGAGSDFEAALAADLDGTTTALRLTADGMYDAASNTFTAQRITVLLWPGRRLVKITRRTSIVRGAVQAINLQCE
jgi:hypothetical protein